MRERIYRTVIFFTRALRWIGWSVATLFAIMDLERFEGMLRRLESAPQEAAAAGAILVELMAVYIMARGSDRIWTLVDEDLQSRLPRTG